MIEPWMPMLLEIEYLKEHGTEEEQEYYSKFGFEKLDVSSEFSHITNRLESLRTRFLGRYGHRQLNSETMEYWQVRLQNKMDEIVAIYDRAYALYEQYVSEIDQHPFEGMKTTRDGYTQASGSDMDSRTIVDEASGSDKTETDGTDTTSGQDTIDRENTRKEIDTPDTAINASDNYADKLTKDDGSDTTRYGKVDTIHNEDEITYGRKDSRTDNGSVTYGKKDTLHDETEQVRTGPFMLTDLNTMINSLKDIDTLVIKEFENNFLNVLWY